MNSSLISAPLSMPPVLPAAVELPAVVGITGPMLLALTNALAVDRSILAADNQIDHAWSNLPRLLSRIPPDKRSETLVRMCVAVATGLFDSAINYAWNAAIIELRAKVRKFGLAAIPQVIGGRFDEEALVELKDFDLLELCLKLNLISEEGHFLLNQCRDIRNNFSAAHPSMGSIDEDEFTNFLSRVGKHALANEHNPRGVDIAAFIASVKASKFTAEQLGEWCRRLSETFEAQRELLFGTLHGIYCDPASGEEARVNGLSICESSRALMTPQVWSNLVDRHQEYHSKGDEPRSRASQIFFERLSALSLLSQSELHSIITSASQALLSAHNARDNFYNEPPFALRLGALTKGVQVPSSAQHKFVETVITCATGNPWGVSTAAMPSYQTMVRSFSPAEIKLMIESSVGKGAIGTSLKNWPKCAKQFKLLVELLDASSVPSSVKPTYDGWMKWVPSA